MMLCGVSSLCHAQKKIKFEYDAAGNLVKRYVPIKYETSSFADKYELKVGPSPTTGPLNIKVLEGRANRLATCSKMQVMVYPATGSGNIPVSVTTDQCEVNVDISNPYSCPKGIYVVVVLLFEEGKQAPVQGTLKIEKK